jgi:hypothetical protein
MSLDSSLPMTSLYHEYVFAFKYVDLLFDISMALGLYSGVWIIEHISYIAHEACRTLERAEDD